MVAMVCSGSYQSVVFFKCHALIICEALIEIWCDKRLKLAVLVVKRKRSLHSCHSGDDFVQLLILFFGFWLFFF